MILFDSDEPILMKPRVLAMCLRVFLAFTASLNFPRDDDVLMCILTFKPVRLVIDGTKIILIFYHFFFLSIGNRQLLKQIFLCNLIIDQVVCN
jgi:hypothetical protein